MTNKMQKLPNLPYFYRYLVSYFSLFVYIICHVCTGTSSWFQLKLENSVNLRSFNIIN